MKKIIITLLFILTAYGSVIYANIGDSCLQMMNGHWKGIYKWNYRGDDYQVSMVGVTKLTAAHQYTMQMVIQSSPVSYLTLDGVCMNSQIYLEDTSLRFPIYLQGTIQNAQIKLVGQRGPNVVSINLKKQS